MAWILLLQSPGVSSETIAGGLKDSIHAKAHWFSCSSALCSTLLVTPTYLCGTACAPKDLAEGSRCTMHCIKKAEIMSLE